jgi:hypothetical protein
MPLRQVKRAAILAAVKELHGNIPLAVKPRELADRSPLDFDDVISETSWMRLMRGFPEADFWGVSESLLVR